MPTRKTGISERRENERGKIIVAAVADLPASANPLDLAYVEANNGIYVWNGAWLQIGGALAEISGATPELRLTETDQTDPAGRYRTGVDGDVFILERSGAAAWANALGSASNLGFLKMDAVNLDSEVSANFTNAWRLILRGGTSADGGTIQIGGSASPISGIELAATNGANTNDIRLSLNASATVGLVTISATTGSVRLRVDTIEALANIRGQSIADLDIRANQELTDITARRISFSVIDPATDIAYKVAQAVPNGANPFFTIFAPDVVPTTSILDVNNIGLRYTPGGAVTLYVNDGGVIKSLSLGTPA